MLGETVDGRTIAACVRARVADDVAVLAAERARVPGLATILVGEDPASAVYVAAKRKACAEVGIESYHHELSGDAPPGELFSLSSMN